MSNNESTFNMSDIRAFRHAFRLLLILWKESPLFSTILAIGTFLTGLVPVAELWVIGYLVNQLADYMNGEIAISAIYGTIVILIVVMLFNRWINILSGGIQDYLRNKVAGRLRHQIHEKAYSLELAFFDFEGWKSR